MNQIDIKDAIGNTIKNYGVIDDTIFAMVFSDDTYAVVRAEEGDDNPYIDDEFCEQSWGYHLFSDVAKVFGQEQALLFRDEWEAKRVREKTESALARKLDRREQFKKLQAEFGEDAS